MSDANRGSGYAGSPQADQRSTDRADDARGSAAPTGPDADTNDREEYGTTTQVMRAVSPGSPAPTNGAADSPAGPGSPNGSAGSNGYSSPWGPYGGSTRQPTYSPGSPSNGSGYYTPAPEAPTTAADAPGDGLPDGAQPTPAVVASWEPVASRSKKPLKQRWSDLTAKLTGKNDAPGELGDREAAERVWASSAAAAGTLPADQPTVEGGPQGAATAETAEAETRSAEPDQTAVAFVPPMPSSAPAEEAEQVVDEQQIARQYSPASPMPESSPWAPTAPEGPPTGPQTAVIPVVEGQAAPDFPQAYATPPVDGPKHKPGVPRRTRKARLRLSRLDPWSVMKTSFLFSIAAGIMLVVAVYVVWTVIGSSGLFDSVNDIVKSVISTPNDTTPFRVEEYINTQKVLGVAALLACVDVIIFTALATLGSFLYNLAATMLGGLEITLAED
ncbi:DUF3566 domain-containing protein [Microlunatus ginsengisoli]|uniref:DUF3566 domain-containing protein n=1 Tax=Microlunatus ginsengisoli TaxID=363863 RepID=A0ABP7A0V6_9ACTN